MIMVAARSSAAASIHTVRILAIHDEAARVEALALLAALARVPGVMVDGREEAGEYLTLRQGAEFCAVNYHTFRNWVVVKKLVPCSRPSGRDKGDLRVKRSDLVRLMDGLRKKKKPGRKGREVNILG